MTEPPNNPFAAPATTQFVLPEVLAASADAEATRRKYLSHEASIQSIGLLYYLGATILLLAACAVGMGRDMGGAATWAVVGVALGLAVVMIVLGRGLRTLDRRVRIPVALLAVLNILGSLSGGNPSATIPVLINVYVLYLMFSAKTKTVFSPEYQEIIRQTPQIKYRTSWIVKGLGLLLLALLLLAVLSFLFFGSGRH